MSGSGENGSEFVVYIKCRKNIKCLKNCKIIKEDFAVRSS